MSPTTTCGEIDDVLADGALAADLRPRHHVRKVPDLRAVADLAPVVDIGGVMRKEFIRCAHRVRPSTIGWTGDVGGATAVSLMWCVSVDGRTPILDAEAASGEHFLVDARVEIGESVAELDLPPVDGDRPERGPHTRLGNERQVGAVGGQKPTHARPFELQKPANPTLVAKMDLPAGGRPEQPQQQVEEMDADVRDDAAGPFLGALPRHAVPSPA